MQSKQVSGVSLIVAQGTEAGGHWQVTDGAHSQCWKYSQEFPVNL